ncbi:MAG TPA: ATP phosphoribosyltransferase [Gemmatimonadaceae bacterium]|jgi:ATP phosphoribosyltransferase|nr:ATP phosphoribosyltransferase [Gemmatimonadaceae bacterium]
MLRIALPNKGRLADEARDLFNDAGLDVRLQSTRSLTASLGGEFEAIFVNATDIAEFVADGAADAGVTGWDLVRESRRELVDLLDLGFGRCRVVVAVREESGTTSLDAVADGARVATVFPALTNEFFATQGKRVQIVPVSGAVEIAPHLGIADLIVDITSTGSTLRLNGLKEISTILDSTARLVTARERKPADACALNELVTALASVLCARGKRYLMANVPRASLPEIKRILPGLNGPTVIDVLNGGECVAVHAVVSADSVYRTIAAVKQLGGQGILVTRIERLTP